MEPETRIAIGVYLCECGSNISEKVDFESLKSSLASLEGVALVDTHRLLCAADGQAYLQKSIEENGLTHVVVAACSPKQHETTFMRVTEQAGLNPEFCQLVNIREQCAWVSSDREEATEKASRLTKAGIKRVAWHAPLERREVDCSPDVLVIGGGIAGIHAANLLAGPDRKVYLVERAASLGGKVKNYTALSLGGRSGSRIVQEGIEQLLRNGNVKVLLESEIEQILGFFGNFEVVVRDNKRGEAQVLNVGSVVLATGFDVFDVSTLTQYSSGLQGAVHTSLEFEELLSSSLADESPVFLRDGKPLESVVIIHCVGRKEVGYCSKICCSYSLKYGKLLKSVLPRVRVVHLYSDMCVPGKSQQADFEEARAHGTEFVRCAVSEVTVDQGDKGLIVRYRSDNGDQDEISADMLILLAAMQPTQDAERFGRMLCLQRDEMGFFAEEHELLSPVSSAVGGVFVAGCARGPSTLAESIVEAEAAAGKILSMLAPGEKLELETRTSVISAAFCIGCQTCVDVCPYGAITLEGSKRVCVVNEVLCHGCGTCAAACPSGAASLKHFTFPQLHQEFAALLR